MCCVMFWPKKKVKKNIFLQNVVKWKYTVEENGK